MNKEKNKLRIRKLVLPAVVLLLITVLATATTIACSHNESVKEPGFGIYLVENGELVLSDQHIKSYNESTHEIELNKIGIEKWNSYITGDIPTLNKSLFSKEFVVKVNGEEIYHGKFWSVASSQICDGVIIQDALFKLDDNNNTISIDYNCLDPRDNESIFSFFD